MNTNPDTIQTIVPATASLPQLGALAGSSRAGFRNALVDLLRNHLIVSAVMGVGEREVIRTAVDELLAAAILTAGADSQLIDAEYVIKSDHPGCEGGIVHKARVFLDVTYSCPIDLKGVTTEKPAPETPSQES